MASTSLVNGLVLLALCGATFAAQEKIPVSVYFESYCPDSVKFLTKQLYPTYLTELSQYMNITLIPYGKSTTTKSETGEYTFTCHHEERECRGNKVIACALHEKDATLAEKLKFINCTSSVIATNTKMEEYPVKECATVSTVKTDSVKTCASDVMGSEYLAEYGNITTDMFPKGLSNIPSVVFNDKYMESESKMAVSNFRQALCSKITGTKPAECTKSGAPLLQSAILPLLVSIFVISRV